MPGFSVSTGRRPVKVIGRLSQVVSLMRLEGASYKKVIPLPCSSCILCRLERSKIWAARLMHEKKFSENAAFLTLTYDDEHITPDYGLVSNEFSKFMKRLRRKLDYEGKEHKLRYFSVGEYGDRYGRPHYHAAIFGFDDTGRVEEAPSRTGCSQYSHPTYDSAWGKGLVRYSELTFESAAYVARYSLKKLSGDGEKAYSDGRLKEFMRCSKGIGKEWFQNYSGDAYPTDSITIIRQGSSIQTKVPRTYDRWLEKEDPALYEAVIQARKDAAVEVDSDSYDDWLESYREAIVAELKQGVFSPRIVE